MKFAHKLIFGTVLFGGLVGIYFLDEAKTEKKEQLAQEKAVALFFNNNDCIKFSLKNSNGEFLFERKDFLSPWYMSSPKSVMADQDTVNSMLVLLRNLSVQRELEQSNELQTFGLDHPALSLSVTLVNGAQKTVYFGNNLDANLESEIKFPSVYAQTTDRSKVLVVDNSSLSSFTSPTYDTLRTKQISRFQPHDVSGIAIRANNQNISLNLEKKTKWLITAPTQMEADQDFVNGYVQTFRDLIADQIEESIDESFLSKHNLVLDQPTAEVTFFDANKNELQKISIYISKSGLWIKMDDGAFGQVGLDKWTTLVPATKEFRNREVISDIAAKCDIDLKDLIADDIIDQPSGDDLNKFGLQEPRKTINCTIDDKDKKVSSKTFTVLVGAHVPLDEKNVYIKRSDSDAVYIVSSEALSALAQ